MLISETGGDQPERERERERERDGVFGEAGGWNVRGRVNMGRVTVKSVVRDRKYEWEIDGMREDKKRKYEVEERWK